MSRYIDADKAKEKKVYSKDRHEYVVPVAELDWLPTADVQEVRHGHWIFRGDYTSTCSCCNNDVDVDHKKEPKYCPDCGAKMDEEEQQ